MREESFCLYGIRFTCYGDVETAKQLAHHARRLMPRVKELELPRFVLNDPDGSYVELISQAGQDFAKIYVPIKEGYVKPEPEVVEEFTVLYHPAWYAYNSANEHIGYIVALGIGWQGPYEFIPLEAEELRDDLSSSLDGKIPSFEMGQWTEYWGSGYWNGDDSRPFEWDDYLTPKLMSIIMYPEVEKYYYDIAPSGTRNRLFKCNPSELIDTISGTNDGAEERILGDGTDFYVCSSTVDSNYDSDLYLTFGVAGEEAASKDDILDQRDDGTYKALETTFEWSHSWVTETASGSRTHGTVTNYDGTPVTENGSDVGVAGYTDWGYFITQLNLSGEARLMNWGSAQSSVESSEYYGACYTITNKTSSLNVSQTATDEAMFQFRFGLAEVDPGVYRYLEFGTGWDDYYAGLIEETQTTYTTDEVGTTYINVSGDEFNISTNDQFTRCDPRYYRVGDIEFFLVCLTWHDFDGPYTKRYIWIQKTATDSIVNYNIEFSNNNNNYMPFPDIKGPDNESLYISTSFRLIRVDEKITKEVMR